MKLSVACLASDLPFAAQHTARAGVAAEGFRAARLDLEDDDVPTMVDTHPFRVARTAGRDASMG